MNHQQGIVQILVHETLLYLSAPCGTGGLMLRVCIFKAIFQLLDLVNFHPPDAFYTQILPTGVSLDSGLNLLIGQYATDNYSKSYWMFAFNIAQFVITGNDSLEYYNRASYAILHMAEHIRIAH